MREQRYVGLLKDRTKLTSKRLPQRQFLVSLCSWASSTRRQRPQFDETKKLIYDTEMMTERDYQHDMYYSREEGRAEGRAEGRVEGKAEGRSEGRAEGQAEARSEVARNCKALGIPVDVIAKATGLSSEEISNL